MITFLRRLVWQVRFLLDGKLRPDPGRTHEFILIANFQEGRAAELCVLSLAHLKLTSEVSRLPNGRANVEFTVIAKAESRELRKARQAVNDAAVQHGGALVSCLVTMRPSS